MNDDELTLLSLVPADGKAIGNISLLEKLGWTQTRYDFARTLLVEKGLLGIGKGRGGSVWLVEPYVQTLLLSLPPDGGFVTRGEMLKRTGWSEERFILVANGMIAAGVARLGPRNNLALILTPEIEEILLENALNGRISDPFDAARVAAQLGWEVNRIYQVRARILEKHDQEAKAERRGKRAPGRARSTSSDAEVRGGTATPRAHAIRTKGPGPVEVFIAYARADAALREMLDRHFTVLRRNGRIRDWNDEQVLAGQEFARTKREKLDRADVVLLLISSDFLDSYGPEIERALERHHADDAVVVPVLLRRCHWEATELGKLTPLPKNGVPVKSWQDHDEAFYDIVQGIEAIVRARSGL